MTDGVKEVSENLYKVEGSAFEKTVLQSDVPVLVDFYADWCGPCKVIAPVLEELAQDYQDRAKFVKVDVDDNQDIAIKYGVQAVPTLLVFQGGDARESLIGAVPRKKIEQALEGVGA